MKKITFVLITILIMLGVSFYNAFPGEIEMLTKDFECSEEDKIVVHYALKSTYDYEYPNVTLGFKIVEDGKTVACNQMKVTVPGGSQGTEMHELSFDVPCAGKNLTLKTAVFYYTKKYKIDEWFIDCN